MGIVGVKKDMVDMQIGVELVSCRTLIIVSYVSRQSLTKMSAVGYCSDFAHVSKLK